jgi:hypothetical protein
MKILALEQETPGTTPEQFTPYLKAEAARVWELYKSGQIREMYFRQDRFEVVPLVPYPGFERLFGE